MVDSWTGTILDIDEPSDEENGYHGGNEIDRFNKLLQGYDLTSSESADVTIRTLWHFLTEKCYIVASDGKKAKLKLPDGLSGDVEITFPNTTGTLTTGALGGGNDWGDNMQTFRNQYIRFANPAASYYYTLVTSAITANRTITIPLLTANDEIAFLNAVQTLLNKTLNNCSFTGLFKSANVALKEEDTLTLSIRNAGDTLYRNLMAATYKIKNYLEVDKQTLDPSGNPSTGKMWIYLDSLDNLVYEDSTGTKNTIGTFTGGGGEINTSSNTGTGAGLAKTKVGYDLPFKSIKAGTNVTITPDTDDITISAVSGATTGMECLENSNTEVNVQGTTSETTVFSYTVVGGTLGTTKKILVELPFKYLNNSGASEEFEIRVKFGGITYFQCTSDAMPSENYLTCGKIILEVWNSGSISSNRFFGQMYHNEGSSSEPTVGQSGNLTTGAMSTVGTFIGDNGSRNTGSDQVLSITIQHTDNSSSIYFTKLNHAVYLLG